MKMFRNPEIKKESFVFFILTLFACIIAFQFHHIFFLLFTLGLCCLFWGIYLVFSYIRYQKMANLALQIDTVLHGNDEIAFQTYTEGEFAILQSEIYKMMVRLREQKHHLQQDKIHLADSIADISHQIRTPLTSINLLVSILSEKQLPDDCYSLLHQLTTLLNRIDHLITALLKISKLDAGTIVFEQKKLSMALLLEKAVQPLLIPCELQNISLVMDTQGDFEGDILWSCEAITNILKNCIEHTPEGGQISIAASENALYSEIVIQDTGTGIPEKDLPHIFERFYKGENSAQNSFGIGLALARMIITSQQGTIKAQNASNEGAIFNNSIL